MSKRAAVATRPDPQEMVIVHRVFRREFRLMPAMVRAVPAGDTAWRQRIAAHCAELLAALHHHHTGEDELVWPRLRERAEAHVDLVQRMQSQHESLAALLERAEAS